MQDACHYYLLPIGGTAMASLAGLLHEAGERVCGVDVALHPPMSEILADLGIPVRLGWDADAIPDGIRQVIIGNAVPRSNPEVVAVLERGLAFTSQAEALGIRFCRDARTVVVAGTHGKTTTTALVTHILESGGLDPTAMIGGVPRGGRPWRLGHGGWCVVEGDEYNTAFFDRGPKFLHYFPHIFLVGNVEFDHGDIYSDLDAILAAFRVGVAQVERGRGFVVANASDAGARRAVEGRDDVVWFGLGDGPGLRCDGWRHDGGGLVASLRWEGSAFEARVPLVGRHNLDNLMAAVTCAFLAGLETAAIVAAAATFAGVRRRLDILGDGDGITVVDDFAHHPTAVALTLAGARFRFPSRRLVAVFEPRSLTAGRSLFQAAWVAALSNADVTVLAPVFHAGRLAPEDLLDREAVAEALRRGGSGAIAPAGDEDLLEAVRPLLRRGDVVLCMSSGDFGGLPRRLLAALGGLG